MSASMGPDTPGRALQSDMNTDFSDLLSASMGTDTPGR